MQSAAVKNTFLQTSDQRVSTGWGLFYMVTSSHDQYHVLLVGWVTDIAPLSL